MEKLELERPEIVIGLVGAVGTDLDPVCSSLASALSEVNYTYGEVRLSHLLHDIPLPLAFASPESPYEEKLNVYMDAGNKWRRAAERGDAVALLAVGKIREERQQFNQNKEDNGTPKHNHAFILRSLKHAQEVETLRSIYGSSFFLLSAYSPRQKRIETLTRQIAASHNSFRIEDYESVAIQAINRDETEAGDDFGQQVRETFWRGDAFIDASDSAHLPTAVQRIIQLWFGHPFHTPTRDEYLMFSAQAAAYRSASLGRQVGAVIATKDGSIIATGANEVPRAGGGTYWYEDDPDGRDHMIGHDSSDSMRREMLGDIIQRLHDNQWLAEDKWNQSVPELVNVLLNGKTAIMKGAEFTGLTEYQRPVHAEMTALTDAARRGVPIEGSTVYTTTFPCHGCARHMVAAGIMRVVYIEPYAKSLARNLHADSIRIEDNTSIDNRVQFEPFVGLAPRRYLELFAMTKRKEKSGAALRWQPSSATPRLGGWAHYMTAFNENLQLAQLALKIRDMQTVTVEGDVP